MTVPWELCLGQFVPLNTTSLPRGLIWRKGNSPNSRKGWDSGVWVPGASKLDHLQPFAPLTFWKISNFFTFILGGQFLLPQMANFGKGEFIQLKKRMRQYQSCLNRQRSLGNSSLVKRTSGMGCYRIFGRILALRVLEEYNRIFATHKDFLAGKCNNLRTEVEKIACTWFGEVPSCCSLSLLLGPTWVLLKCVLQTIFSAL